MSVGLRSCSPTGRGGSRHWARCGRSCSRPDGEPGRCRRRKRRNSLSCRRAEKTSSITFVAPRPRCGNSRKRFKPPSTPGIRAVRHLRCAISCSTSVAWTRLPDGAAMPTARPRGLRSRTRFASMPSGTASGSVVRHRASWPRNVAPSGRRRRNSIGAWARFGRPMHDRASTEARRACVGFTRETMAPRPSRRSRRLLIGCG